MPDEALNTDVPNQALVPDICATGTDIKWYSANDTNTTVVLQADCYNTPYVDDLGKMKDGLYPMYATQTLNGCQSEPVQVILTITNCPIPKPTAIKYHACTEKPTLLLRLPEQATTLAGGEILMKFLPVLLLAMKIS
ncbi:MAG: hypothetical protein IPO21_14005 [Bacteroidales bacterium]|nr:hypothetical protein [Bacteroidales bacterium]